MSKVRCKVIGILPVNGVSKPGEVELDSGRVNIDALVQSGHVEFVPDKPAAKVAEKK
jgi:hypothetical protein